MAVTTAQARAAAKDVLASLRRVEWASQIDGVENALDRGSLDEAKFRSLLLTGLIEVAMADLLRRYSEADRTRVGAEVSLALQRQMLGVGDVEADILAAAKKTA